MIKDTVVEEVRQARNEYAKQFNYDLDAICKDLQQKQERSGRTLVSFFPVKDARQRSALCSDPSAQSGGAVSDAGLR